MKITRLMLVLMTAISATRISGAFAEEKSDAGKKKRSVKYSIILRGAHCDEDVKVLTDSLKKMKGIRFKAEDITAGTKPRYFTDPFVVEILDTEKTNIGALAETISKAQTPHRKDFPPKVNLALFAEDRITEADVMSLRSELMNVNGVEVLVSGGLGGFFNKGYYWIQLENAGGAILKEILDAVKKSKVKANLEKREN